MPFRFRQPSDASLTAAQPEGREAASIGAAAAALVALFLVLLSVFVYLSRLNRGPAGAEVGLPGIAPTAAVAPQAEAPAPVGGGFLGMLGVLSAGAADRYQTLQDDGWSYELALPKDWPSAELSGSGQRLAQAQHDRVVEDPASGARLALSVWEAGEDQAATLQDWAQRLAPGLSPVDGSWEANATVAGEAALCLWSAEAATQPLRLATLLRHGDRLYLLSYSAPDGGAGLGHYLKALVSLRFLDQELAAEAADQVPLLPLPEPRYYPSGQLFR